jgi:hypothetical protein
MLIRFLLRRALRSSYRSAGLKNLSRIRGRGGYGIEDLLDIAPKFDEQAWEEGINEILSWAEDQAGNAGQTTLIVDYLTPKVLDYCEFTQEEYDPDEFVDVMKDELGDDYYYAINEIIDEMAFMLDELRDACHQSFLENLAFRISNPFGYASLYVSTPTRQYSSNAAALFNYRAASIRNGYKAPTTAANRAYNSERKRRELIKRFGAGPTKPLSSRSGMENMPGYAAYQQAAARNGKIIKP